MSFLVRRVRPSDLSAAESLLSSARLPTNDLVQHLSNVFAAWEDGTLVGVVGLEDHGTVGLLRSLVVAESHRGQGLARLLCDAVMARAATLGLPEIWLLTMTADGWFAGLGFERVDRSLAPTIVRGHPQFTDLCPDSAVLMRWVLAS